MRMLVAVLIALLMCFTVAAQEGAVVESVVEGLLNPESASSSMDLVIKTCIALAFAWLGKHFAGKAWMKALLEGLEVGVNEAWETYVKGVKAAKKPGEKMTDEEKGTARKTAMEKAKNAMGFGAKILMATMPQAKVFSLISGIVNRRQGKSR